MARDPNLIWQSTDTFPVGAKGIDGFSQLESVRPEQYIVAGGKLRCEVKFPDHVQGLSESRCLLDVGQLQGVEGDEWWIYCPVTVPTNWIGRFPKWDELATWVKTAGKSGYVNGGTFFEIHHGPLNGDWNSIGGSAPMYFGADDKNLIGFLVDPKTQEARPDATWALAPITKGKEQVVLIHVKLSTNPSVGFIEIFVDGKNVVQLFRAATMYPGTYMYPVFGIYRRGFIGDPSLLWPPNTPAAGQRVFPDNDGIPQAYTFSPLKIGKTKESVMPAATTPAPTPTPTPAPSPAPAGTPAPSVSPTDGATQLMATRDWLTSQISAMQSQVDAINGLLNKGRWTGTVK
jgi:hypothetical protein